MSAVGVQLHGPRGSADKPVSHLELPNDQFCLDAGTSITPYPRLPSAACPKQNYLDSWGPQINERNCASCVCVCVLTHFFCGNCLYVNFSTEREGCVSNQKGPRLDICENVAFLNIELLTNNNFNICFKLTSLTSNRPMNKYPVK